MKRCSAQIDRQYATASCFEVASDAVLVIGANWI